MKKKILTVAFVLVALGLQAQPLQDILDQICDNNLQLAALRESVEARKQSNMASAALPDPELEFAYLFSNPATLGRRRDISVSQSIDFATINGSRVGVAKGENAILELEYKAMQRDILLQAEECLVEIVHRNALIAEYEKRVDDASKVEQNYKSAYGNGGITIVEYNKAAMNLSTAQAELFAIVLERDALLTELKILNGGNELSVDSIEWGSELLPASFEDWFAEASENSSAMNYVRAATSLSQQQLRLSKGEAAPSVSVGYMAELVPGSEFRGVSVGLSVPLWSSKRRVSAANLQMSAAQKQEQSEVIAFKLSAEALYNKTKQLHEMSLNYSNVINVNNNSGFLIKSLGEGQISLTEYILELAYYYEVITKAIDAERDFRLSMAILRSYQR